MVEALRYKPEGRGFNSRWCHWNFLLIQSFRPHYGPRIDSASNRNENQEYFLWVKAASAYGWQTYHLHVPIFLKSGSLNLLEPSGPVQACNGITFYYKDLGFFIVMLSHLLCSFRRFESDTNVRNVEDCVTHHHISILQPTRSTVFRVCPINSKNCASSWF
jgi:hypothetical protein